MTTDRPESHLERARRHLRYHSPDLALEEILAHLEQQQAPQPAETLAGVEREWSSPFRLLENRLDDLTGRVDEMNDLIRTKQEPQETPTMWASLAGRVSILANRDDKILHWQDEHDWMHSSQAETPPPSPPQPATCSHPNNMISVRWDPPMAATLVCKCGKSWVVHYNSLTPAPWGK